VRSTATYPEAPGVHKSDDNFVNGSEVPALPADVFRGDDATEVKVLFMPSDYDNRQTAKRRRAYRLVYSESSLGSVQGFHGAYDFVGTAPSGFDASFKNGSAPEAFEAWVKDASWVEAGATNAVSFTLNMPLATNRVSVVIENAMTFMDVWEQIGGALGLLVAIFLLSLTYLERCSDVQDPLGSIAKEVGEWVARRRQKWREDWNPEPESWSMANISKMQRREEKREGGARKVEDSAISNFKDLYARNKITSGGGGGGVADEDEVYDHEVDDFHGQL